MGQIQASVIRTEGNVIYLRCDPAIGVLALTSFSDDANGNTAGDFNIDFGIDFSIANSIYFEKQFRYSLNGVTWNDWQPLTLSAITSISVATTDTLLIELQYTKFQPLGTDALTVTEATIGDTLAAFTEGQAYAKSVFVNYFPSNSIDVLRWQISVLEKLYESGIIPSFIDRLNEQGLPDDFVDFWKSITKFFAFLVVYSRQFQNFNLNQYLLAEYLEEKGMATSVNNSLEELTYLMNTFNKQVFNRGTTHIIDKETSGSPVDGELLRIIYYLATDEFLFNLYKPEHFGWNLGNSSPLHKGLYLNDSINKSYETGTQVTNLSLYPLTGTVTKVVDGGNSTMFLSGAGGISAAGGLKYIKIDPSLDYEVSFIIKKSAGATLKFGATCYDINGTQLSFVSSVDGTTSTNFFLQNATLVRNDKYILVRGFLYNYSNITAKPVLELNQGNNLIFPYNAASIIPTITISSGTANIYAVRILPMQTTYSRGFLNSKNFISIWLKNNNAHYSLKQLKQYIAKYLTNYNSKVELSSIGDNMYNYNG